MPPPPTWTAPHYAAPAVPGWTAPPAYPTWMLQYPYGPGPGYPTMPGIMPPFFPTPFQSRGSGYTMAQQIPVGCLPHGQGGRQGSLDSAREENNENSISANQGNAVTWSEDINNAGSNAGNKNNGDGWCKKDDAWASSGDGGQQSGNVNNNNNQGDDSWANSGGQNQDQSGDSTWENSGQPAGDDTNKGNNWENNNSNNAQINEVPNDWDNNASQDQPDQNNQQHDGAWDNKSNNANNNQNNNGWLVSGNNNQAQSTNWPQQPTGTSPVVGARQSRPLYGPYGAYYSVRTATTDLDDQAQEEEEPPYDVPEPVAQETRTTYQVQPGKGYLYLHKRASPEYLDSIDEPYARFVFKYRTKGESDCQDCKYCRFLETRQCTPACCDARCTEACLHADDWGWDCGNDWANADDRSPVCEWAYADY